MPSAKRILYFPLQLELADSTAAEVPDTWIDQAEKSVYYADALLNY